MPADLDLKLDEPLPRALAARIATELTPIAPTADAAARIKRRVLAGVRAPGVTTAIAAASEPAPIDVPREHGWMPLRDGIDYKVLFDDGGMMSWLARLQPGAAFPPHTHRDGLEECVVIEGAVVMNERTYRAGDYFMAPRHSRHDVARSETGCLLFFRSASVAMRGGAAAGR